MLSLSGTVAAAGGYVGTRIAATEGPREIGNAGLSTELFGGYRFNDRWSIELGAIGGSDDLDYSGYSPDLKVDTEVDWSALTLSARADFPLSKRIGLHVRAGVASIEVESETRFDLSGTDFAGVSGTATIDGSSVGGVLAIGVDFALGGRWSMGMEMQHLEGDFSIGCGAETGYSCGFNNHGGVQGAALSLRADF